LLIQHGSRATEEGALLFPGCCQIAFHIYGKIQRMRFLYKAVSLLNVTTFKVSLSALPRMVPARYASHGSGKKINLNVFDFTQV